LKNSGLAAPVLEQQGGHWLAEARADAPLPAGKRYRGNRLSDHALPQLGHSYR